MKSYPLCLTLFFGFCLFFCSANMSAQDFCAADRLHERLMNTNQGYAQTYERNNQRIAQMLQSKALDLNNSTQVTIPLIVHIMHTGGAVGSIYNPTDEAINSMIAGLNDFYANSNGMGLDINISFVLAKRDENCAPTTGINRVDASGVANYTADGIDAGGGVGADEETVKALSKWNNIDYYNIWIVNKIEGKDGTSGSFTAGYAYYPGASAAVDGTVMLATQIAPTKITLAHEIGHALNLAHTFNGDGDGTTCPSDTDCATEGDYVCDTPAHKRNAFTCITSGNTCNGDPVGDVYKNFMAYSGCQDRFTTGQRSRMRAALELSRPGLVNSKGGDAPAGSTPSVSCVPTGIDNSGNTYNMGTRKIDWDDVSVFYEGYSRTEEFYKDFSCNQRFAAYPGQEISFSASTMLNRQIVRVYIDYNNNGTLDDSGELAFSHDGVLSWDEVHSGTITIAANAVTETPLRMRVWGDWVNTPNQGPCGNLQYGQAVDFTVTVENVDVWKGTTSNDWSVGSNWAKGTAPTSTGNVRISASAPNQPHITALAATPAVCNNIEIEAGATLTINAGKALTVSGNVENEGALIVKADAAGIGSLITEGTVSGSGSFQMEQYLTGTGGGTPNGVFHYVGSPLVGAQASGFDLAAGNKLWSYSESDNGYTQIVNGATALSPLVGYTVRAGANVTRTLTGTSFNTGTQTTGLSRTGTSNLKRGYHLVANPYPSTVNWDAATRINLEPTIWYRTNQSGSMVFDTYNASSNIGTNNNLGGAVTGNIPPGQAVWVRVDADGNTGTLGFNNGNRSHGTLASIYKTEAQEGVVRITLSNAINSDETILLFNTDAQDGFDEFDSRKYWAANIPQLYTNVAEDTLVINGLSNTLTNPVVDLGMKLPEAGNYSLHATSITLPNQSVYLEDKALGVFQDLDNQAVYSFTSDAGNIADRFALHFNMVAVGTNADAMSHTSSTVYTSNQNTIHILLPEKIENGKVDVMDMSGRVIQTTMLKSNNSAITLHASAGIYLVRISTENGTATHKVKISR